MYVGEPRVDVATVVAVVDDRPGGEFDGELLEHAAVLCALVRVRVRDPLEVPHPVIERVFLVFLVMQHQLRLQYPERVVGGARRTVQFPPWCWLSRLWDRWAWEGGHPFEVWRVLFCSFEFNFLSAFNCSLINVHHLQESWGFEILF